jgi:DNA polymerase III subunit alpha
MFVLKMDILGLRTLTVVSDAVKHIKNNYGIDIDVQELYKFKETEPLKIIGEGHTDGIFQLEGAGMTEFMRKFKPKSFPEVIAGVSLYRPGPMERIPIYLRNRRNPSMIQYGFKEAESILEETYGELVYQEQCMFFVIAIAGYLKSHSDSFRKAIGKKNMDLIMQHREWFIHGREGDDPIPGGIAMGHPLEKLEQIYDEMQKFGSYAFNKSHAAAYAVLAYVTAWLKYYYPVEFMAALLDSVTGNKKKTLRYINHCKTDLVIEVSNPDINSSASAFVPTGKTIAFSLMAKGCKGDAIEAIVKERETNGLYTSLIDFLSRCGDFIDKTTYEALVSTGALDCFGIQRSSLIAGLDDTMDIIRKINSAKKRALASKRPRDINFIEKFNGYPNPIPEGLLEYPDEVLLRLEKNYLGIYLSGHPLLKYADVISDLSQFKTSEIEYEVLDDGTVIYSARPTAVWGLSFVCIINSITEFVTKHKTLMAGLDLEDLDGTIRGTVFPDAYEKYKSVLKENEIYYMVGNIQMKDEELPSFICSQIVPLKEKISENSKVNQDTSRFYLTPSSIEEAKQMMDYIKSVKAFGKDPVFVRHNDILLLLDKSFWLNAKLFSAKRDASILPDNKIKKMTRRDNVWQTESI